MENIIKKITQVDDVTFIDDNGVVINKKQCTHTSYYCVACNESFGKYFSAFGKVYLDHWNEGRVEAMNHFFEVHFRDDDFVLQKFSDNVSAYRASITNKSIVECKYCHIQFTDIDKIIEHKKIHEKIEVS